jgi:ATPase family associated with various cellular activities (AAA)
MNGKNNSESAGAFLEALRATEVDVFDAPLYRDFGPDGYHECTVHGNFDMDQILKDRPGQLFSSRTGGSPIPSDAKTMRVRLLLFKMDDKLWLKCDSSELTVFAADLSAAIAQANKLAEKFGLPPEAEETEPYFFILSVRRGELRAQSVKVTRPFLIKREEMTLHYGDGFAEWEDALLEKLHTPITGLTLLRGEPGTGKTSFIRHLMSRLWDTHSFFYLPVSLSHTLCSPDTIDFWAQQSNRLDGRQVVVILEDAESLLEERTGNNRSRLEDFLNISDGLMSEVLRIQVIATINCPVHKLDPAITRPGRLVAFRNFSRMPWSQAQALAAAKGLKLPEQDDYSIAEIYAGLPVKIGELSSRKMGFVC